MRADCHIHIDRIGPPHRTEPPDTTEVVEYARREGIGLFGAIYERDETLARFRAAGLTLFPFFWVRTPLPGRPGFCARDQIAPLHRALPVRPGAHLADAHGCSKPGPPGPGSHRRSRT